MGTCHVAREYSKIYHVRHCIPVRGVAHTIYGGKVGETMGLVFYCRQTFGLKCTVVALRTHTLEALVKACCVWASAQ